MKIKVAFPIIVLSGFLFVAPASDKTWHVPGDAATIQGGINLASTGDTVMVGCGTYNEYDISMKSGVCLTSETGDPGCVTIDAQQNGRVFYCRFVAATARIEGFTIKGGDTDQDGGLSCLDNSSPSFNGSIIVENSATDEGGGVYCYTNSSPTFIDCAFTGNSAETGGAFSENVASAIGGGTYISRDCDATFTDCTFSGNSAENWGGGMSTSFGGSATLANCTFSDNSAYSAGGAHFGSDGAITLTNCTFARNSASGAAGTGGGMRVACNGGCASVALTNCSLRRNSAKDGGGIYMEGASYLAADSTVFRDNTASNEGPHGYMGSTSEAVLTCCVTDLSGFAGDGTITLNNDGCWVPVERTTWGRIKGLYR